MLILLPKIGSLEDAVLTIKNYDTRFAPNLMQNFRKYRQKKIYFLHLYIPLQKIDGNNIPDIRMQGAGTKMHKCIVG